MIYREFRGEKLSALGFGSMRMPVVDGDYGKVDYKAAEEMVDCAMRGGKLCSLSAEDEAKLKALRPQESVTGWGFRFVQSVPEVVVTLSGMSTLAQVQENIKTFETDAPLGAGELEALFGIAREMTGKASLPCTACRYCTSHCPKKLDIPELIKLYNEHRFTGGGFIAPMAVSTLPAEKRPSACIGCGSCAKVCPQQIDIPGMMKDFAARLAKSE